VNNPRLSRIDETSIGDHYHLSSEDECYFFYEYTSGAGYSGGTGNNLISNLKKSPSRRGKPEYVYKDKAINQCASLFSNAIEERWAASAVFVPVPPSKAKDHADYDDRMVQICSRIRLGGPVDVRELVVQSVSMDAAHASGVRPSIADLLQVYRIDETLCDPLPQRIAIVDDVLTAGVHYKAMKSILSGRFPNAQIIGLFVARVARPQFDVSLDFL
jgi:hypothetical protein